MPRPSQAVVSQQQVEQTAAVLRGMHGMAVDVLSVPGKAHAMPQVQSKSYMHVATGLDGAWDCCGGRMSHHAPMVQRRHALVALPGIEVMVSKPPTAVVFLSNHRPASRAACLQGEAEMRRLMAFWAKHLSRRPTAADLPPGAAAAEGQLLEVRPGEVSIELVGQQEA